MMVQMRAYTFVVKRVSVAASGNDIRRLVGRSLAEDSESLDGSEGRIDRTLLLLVHGAPI